jgi:hypothetical protein
VSLVYYENVGQAVIKLAWSSPSTPLQLIPTARLHSSIKDSDADGMPNDWETRHELDPQNPADAGFDPDKDGLTNRQEYEVGTNPRVADSDGDGLPDRWEVESGLKAYDGSDAPQDQDADGLTNLEEFQRGTNPRNADTHGDGLPDGMEVH